MTTLRTVILAALALAAPGAYGDDEVSRTAPLFSSNDVLEVTIGAPFATIMRERSTEEDTPATLTYREADETEVSLEIGIRTRGRYRHQKRVCPFAPLRLNFKKGNETLFAGSDKLKLVSHCRDGGRYSRALLREFLAYRILNVLTDQSFRVRLLDVTYLDTESNKTRYRGHAFLIEHRDQLAERLGLDVLDVETIDIEELDGAYTNLVSVFQYMIANADFSPIRGAKGERCCHNTTLFSGGDEPVVAIPYDFDMTGIVSAPHSQPNPRFGLRNVRERLYRGRCQNNPHLDTTIQLFKDKKGAIMETMGSYEHLHRGSVNRATRFVEEFFDTIESPKRVERELRGKCI